MQHLPTYAEWREVTGNGEWKFGWFNFDPKIKKGYAVSAQKVTKSVYGQTEPANVINVSKGQVKPSEWLLTFDLSGVNHLAWMYVNFVVDVDPNDEMYEEDYPLEAVQANPLSLCPDPPFAIDNTFRGAFKRAVRTFGSDKIEATKSLRPTERFLVMLDEEFAESIRRNPRTPRPK